MLPLLKHYADGREHSSRETLEALAAHYGLTDEERTRRLPSGQQTVFANRVAWAKSHFKHAGVIESPQRATYRITQRGRDLLATAPSRIDLRLLNQFPEHRKFKTSGQKSPPTPPIPLDVEITPEEHIATGYQQIREELADELLAKIKECSPAFFERLVIDLLLAMGYGGSRQDAGRAVGRSGDGGIDGTINEDRLGLEVIYLQAKRWDAVVGRPEIQRFAGALQGRRARKGVFITTSAFTKDAIEYVAAIDSKIVLIDGEELATLMIDHGVGVTQVESYVVKRLDSDYFTEE